MERTRYQAGDLMTIIYSRHLVEDALYHVSQVHKDAACAT
jgi:hypothetical protein